MLLVRPQECCQLLAGRMEFRGYKPQKYVQCPVCDIPVVHHQLTKHLILDHNIEMVKAGNMAGKVLRKTWSTSKKNKEDLFLKLRLLIVLIIGNNNLISNNKR